MDYYKIIVDNSIVGCGVNYLRYQKRNDISILTNRENCEYVTFNGICYHDAWMNIPPSELTITQATIKEIEEEEFESISKAFEENIEITIQDEEQEEEQPIVEEDTTSLDFVKESKINKITKATEVAIENGVDYDGKHYSYTIEDQLNLLTILQNGQNEQFYHADGEDVQLYTYDTIYKINTKLTLWKNLNLSYLNSAKNYINSLTNLEEISALNFGCDIPQEFQTDAYIKLSEEWAANV